MSEVSYIFDIYLEFIHMLQVSVFPSYILMNASVLFFEM